MKCSIKQNRPTGFDRIGGRLGNFGRRVDHFKEQ